MIPVSQTGIRVHFHPDLGGAKALARRSRSAPGAQNQKRNAPRVLQECLRSTPGAPKKRHKSSWGALWTQNLVWHTDTHTRTHELWLPTAANSLSGTVQMFWPLATTSCGDLRPRIASLELFKCFDLWPQRTVVTSGCE